jgi:hypothetical protein
MNRRWVLLLIALNLIGLTGLVFIYPQFMVAPGPLVPAHANLEANCFACHAPLRGVAADRCISCHKVADIGLRMTTGSAVARATTGITVARATPITPFHQGLTAQNCTACHTDHTHPALISKGQPAFSHALLSAAIRENCTACHTAPRTPIHRGVTAQCTQCHSQDSWKSASFDHTRFFVLDRDHNAPCATCHTTSDRRQYTCYGCHEHTEANIRAKHIREGIQNFTNCVACHRSAHGDDD